MGSLLDQTRDAIRKTYPAFEYAAFDQTVIAPLGKPVSECRLALITTGGLHLTTEPPFDTKHPDGDCSYRMLPGSVGLSAAAESDGNLI